MTDLHKIAEDIAASVRISLGVRPMGVYDRVKGESDHDARLRCKREDEHLVGVIGQVLTARLTE